MDDELDEPRALALWCAWLPELRARAVEGFWTDRLTRAEARVREGSSAVAACRKFGLTGPSGPPPSSRGEPLTPGVVVAPGLDPVPSVGRGSYTCPQRRCPRRASRDDSGRPPTCTLFDGASMIPVS